jgi:hypothetical protein
MRHSIHHAQELHSRNIQQTNHEGEHKMSKSIARKTLATIATGAMAAAALVAIAQPATATDGDPFQLGYLQVTPTSGVIDGDLHKGWVQTAFTNDGQVCPAGNTLRAGFYAVVDGNLVGTPAAGVIRSGVDYMPVHGGIEVGETSVYREGQYVAADSVSFPWVTVAVTGGTVELRHTCHAANAYDQATDPYYSVTIEVQPGGAWVVTQQGSPSGDSSESDINVNVPEAQTPTTPTGLKISVKPNPVTLTNAATREAGQVWTATGTLSDVTVNDDRRDAAAAGWTLNGKASDFVSGANTISSQNLGWTPAKVSGQGTEGAAAAPNVDGGLSTNKTLATGTASDSADVKTTVNAALKLDVPASAADGSYKSTLTLTLI